MPNHWRLQNVIWLPQPGSEPKVSGLKCTNALITELLRHSQDGHTVVRIFLDLFNNYIPDNFS